jgi:hypothetical protein
MDLSELPSYAELVSRFHMVAGHVRGYNLPLVTQVQQEIIPDMTETDSYILSLDKSLHDLVDQVVVSLRPPMIPVCLCSVVRAQLTKVVHRLRQDISAASLCRSELRREGRTIAHFHLSGFLRWWYGLIESICVNSFHYRPCKTSETDIALNTYIPVSIFSGARITPNPVGLIQSAMKTLV